MPYCKYCGKKLEGGEKCSCPEASEKNSTLAGAADEIKEAASEKIENISENAAGLKNESEKAARIGISFVSSSFLRTTAVSKPLISGIMTSSRIRSGCSFFVCSIHVVPLFAVHT